MKMVRGGSIFWIFFGLWCFNVEYVFYFCVLYYDVYINLLKIFVFSSNEDIVFSIDFFLGM